MTPTPVQAHSPAVATLIEEAQRSERAGHREIARRKYETAVYLLGRHDAAVSSMIIRRIARTYIDEGQYDVAMDCLHAALGIAESQDDLSGIAHAMNWMANIQLSRGDADEAEHLYAMARAHAKAAGDGPLNAMIAQNLGVIASMRGDLAAALEHYASSLVTYRTVGLREQVGHVLNNMGLVYTRLGRFDEAQAAYDDAVAHCEAVGDVPNRLLSQCSLTTLLLARGDVDDAARLGAQIFAEASEVGDQRALAETLHNLGVVALRRGDLAEAERRLSAAFDDAIRREDLLLAAETAREQAKLYEALDQNRETLKSLSLSHRLFAKLRAGRDLADVKHRVVRLERQFYDIVTRWAQTIESADAYTRGHCERVADYACALARDVGFDDITMFWFRIGALLHDVGKIVVPPEILNKPGRFTPEERTIMERHAAAGSELLGDIDFPWDILPMVRGHHERWDGSGYPDRLAGEAISLSARITCIADVFDALTTDRPYRPGYTREDALKIMAVDRGVMFDPALFDRFVAIMPTMPSEPMLHTPLSMALV